MKTSVIVLFSVALTAQLVLGGQPTQFPPASKKKMLGLIGGTSWYSTIDYYRYINKAVNDAYGNNTNPPLLIYNLNQQRIQELQSRNQWDEVAAILTEAVMRLHAEGAQAVLFCANTPHKVTRRLRRKAESRSSILGMVRESQSRRAV